MSKNQSVIARNVFTRQVWCAHVMLAVTIATVHAHCAAVGEGDDWRQWTERVGDGRIQRRYGSHLHLDSYHISALLVSGWGG
jgi:hypothetical protein